MAQFWNQKAFKNTSEWHQKYIGMVPEIGRNGTRFAPNWHPKWYQNWPFLRRALENLFRRDLVTRLFRGDPVTRLFLCLSGSVFATLLTFERFFDLRGSICKAPKTTGWRFFLVFSHFSFFLFLFCFFFAPFWSLFGSLFGPIFGPILDAFCVGMVPKIRRNEFKFVPNLVPEMVVFVCYFGWILGVNWV